MGNGDLLSINSPNSIEGVGFPSNDTIKIAGEGDSPSILIETIMEKEVFSLNLSPFSPNNTSLFWGL